MPGLFDDLDDDEFDRLASRPLGLDDLSDDDFDALASAPLKAPEPQGVRVVGRDGTEATLSPEMADIAIAQGARPFEEVAAERRQQELQAEYGGLGGQLQAGAQAGARGLSLGLSDAASAALTGALTSDGPQLTPEARARIEALNRARAPDQQLELPASTSGFSTGYEAAREYQRNLQEANPITAGTLEVGGALLGGAGGLLAKGGALAATPAGLASRAALGAQEAVGARLGGSALGRIGATAAGGAVEGAIAGAAQQVADAVPEFSTDPIEAAEHILYGAGEGALLGSVLGAGFTGTAELAKGAGRLGARALGDLVPNTSNLRQWAGESAYKAVVGRTNKTSQKFAARHGGDAAVGQTLLDEGIPLAAAPEEILAVTSRRADEIGAQLGAKAKEIDQLGGVPISGREVMQRIDQEVLEPLRGNVFADDIASAVESKLARFREIMAGRDPDGAVLRPTASKLGGMADDIAEEAVPASGLMGAAPDPSALPRSGLMGEAASAGPQLKPARSAAGRVDSGLMGGAPDRNLSFDDVRRMRMDLDSTLAKWESAGPPSPTTQALRDVRTELEHAWLDAAERSANSVGVTGYADEIRALKTKYAHMRLAADQAEEALLTRKANRFISLSDNIWGAGALGGAALGDPLGIAAGMATSLAHKYVRERGRGIAALALNQMATLAERKTAMVALATRGESRLNEAATKLVTNASRGRYAVGEAIASKFTDDDYAQAVAEAQQLGDPRSPLSQHLAQTAQQLEMVNPGMGQAYANAARARGQLIAGKLPQPAHKALFGPAPALDPMTQRSVRRTVQAAHEPQKALERLAAGSDHPEDAEAVRVIYPAMFQRFQNRVVEELQRLKKPPPYETRLRIAYATGLAVDPTMQPGEIGFLQQIAKQPDQQQQAEQQDAQRDAGVAQGFKPFDANEHYAGPVDSRIDRR